MIKKHNSKFAKKNDVDRLHVWGHLEGEIIEPKWGELIKMGLLESKYEALISEVPVNLSLQPRNTFDPSLKQLL